MFYEVKVDDETHILFEGLLLAHLPKEERWAKFSSSRCV